MSLKIFDILQEIRALEDMLNEIDPITGEFVNNEDIMKDYIKGLQVEKETKLNNIEDLKLEFKSQIEALKQKEEKLYAKRKSIESNIERLKDLQVMLLQGEKLKTDEYTFSFRTTKSVVVPNEVNKSLEMFTKTKVEWDKVAIKKELDKGIDYSEYGIYLEDKKSLSVR